MSKMSGNLPQSTQKLQNHVLNDLRTVQNEINIVKNDRKHSNPDHQTLYLQPDAAE